MGAVAPKPALSTHPHSKFFFNTLVLLLDILLGSMNDSKEPNYREISHPI
jgi:hypothetical protein